MCKFGQARPVICNLKIRQDEAVLYEGKNQTGIAKMKRRFREHRIAGEQRFGNLSRDSNSPVMVPVTPIGKSHKKSGVGECPHLRE